MKWNKYTQYSKWAALLFFIIVLPILSFSIGRKYQEVVVMNEIVALPALSSQPIENNADAADPCADLTQQQSMNQCAYDEFKKVDEELNKLYSRVTESEQFKSDIGPKIAASQKSWTEYRKLECEAEGSHYEGGSLEPLIVSDCMTMLTKERIGVLNTWLESFSI